MAHCWHYRCTLSATRGHMACTVSPCHAVRAIKHCASTGQRRMHFVPMPRIRTCQSQEQCEDTVPLKDFLPWSRTLMRSRIGSIWTRWSFVARTTCRKVTGTPWRWWRRMAYGDRNASSVHAACHSAWNAVRQRLVGASLLTVETENLSGGDAAWLLLCRAAVSPALN